MADPEKKSLCPECETENAADAKKCSRCGLSLEEFSAFDRLMNARDKKKKREADAAEAERKKNQPEEPKGFFRYLRGGN